MLFKHREPRQHFTAPSAQGGIFVDPVLRRHEQRIEAVAVGHRNERQSQNQDGQTGNHDGGIDTFSVKEQDQKHIDRDGQIRSAAIRIQGNIEDQSQHQDGTQPDEHILLVDDSKNNQHRNSNKHLTPEIGIINRPSDANGGRSGKGIVHLVGSKPEEGLLIIIRDQLI